MLALLFTAGPFRWQCGRPAHAATCRINVHRPTGRGPGGHLSDPGGTSTPSAHSSTPRSPHQDHHQDPHDANSRLQTGGITTIGPRHADDTPPRASYGRNSPHRCITTKVARNFPRSFFETARKRCNSNVLNSMFEILAGELRATLLGNHSGISHRRGHRREGHRRAWLRCPWAVAGPGRASRRRAERSSRRGRLAGGPPPTGTTSSPA